MGKGKNFKNKGRKKVKQSNRGNIRKRYVKVSIPHSGMRAKWDFTKNQEENYQRLGIQNKGLNKRFGGAAVKRPRLAATEADEDVIFASIPKAKKGPANNMSVGEQNYVRELPIGPSSLRPISSSNPSALHIPRLFTSLGSLHHSDLYIPRLFTCISFLNPSMVSRMIFKCWSIRIQKPSHATISLLLQHFRLRFEGLSESSGAIMRQWAEIQRQTGEKMSLPCFAPLCVCIAQLSIINKDND